MELTVRGLVIIPALRAWRQRALFTREALAHRSGVPVSTIAKVERGETKAVHVAILDKLAQGLGISRDQLLTEPTEERT